MAALSALKRGGAPMGRPQQAKKAKAAESALASVDTMLSAVASAVDRATAVSCTSREMLRRMSSGCLGTPVDQRHKYQAAVAEMLREVLARAEESVAEGVGQAAAEMDGAASRVSSVAASRGSVEASLASSTDALEAAKAGFRRSNLSLQSARKALDEAVDDQARNDGKVQRAGATKEAMEKALDEHFKTLMCENADLGPHVDALARLNTEAEVDEGLAKAFLVAGRKDPRTRSTFDQAVLKQLQSDYSKRIAELDRIVAAGSPGREERAAAVASAEAALAEARGRQRETAEALRSAELDRREAEAAAWASKDAERSAAGALRQAEALHSNAERDLEDFRSGPLTALEILLSRRSGAEGGREASAAAAAA